jgi:AcrR family transcriptional regulator
MDYPSGAGSCQQVGGTRKARAAETAVALKAAARTVFARQGYLNTKITDITAEAGRAAGSFYNHFASKEALLEALAADFMAETDELITDHGQHHDLSDPAILREHVAVFWWIYTGHAPEIEAMMQAALVDREFAATMRRYRSEQVRPWRQHLEQLGAAGFSLPGPPTVVALAMVAQLERFCQLWLIEDDQVLAADDAIDILTRLILHGLRGPVPVTH